MDATLKPHEPATLAQAQQMLAVLGRISRLQADFLLGGPLADLRYADPDIAGKNPRFRHDFREVIGYLMMTPELAARILGRDKVFAGNDIFHLVNHWGLGEDEMIMFKGCVAGEEYRNFSIRYTEATLREAAVQNRKQGTDWRLVFHLGLSLRRQHELRGADKKKQPCFYKDNTWWLKDSEDFWATLSTKPGWYLVDFNGRWAGLTWNNQEAELQKLGHRYARCQESVFTEAILSIFMFSNVRLAETWYHWGPIAASVGCRVVAGYLGYDGLSVDGGRPEDCCGLLRVCVFRKFDA